MSGRAVRAAQTIAGTGGVHEERVVLPTTVGGLLLISVESGPLRESRKVIVAQ